MATVIRIKRRRSSEPNNALVMTCRKNSNDLGRRKNFDQEEVEEKIFYYATTLKSEVPIDKDTKAKVMKAIMLREKFKACGKNGQSKLILWRSLMSEHNRLDKFKSKLKRMKLPHQRSEEPRGYFAPKELKRRASSPMASAFQGHAQRYYDTSKKQISSVDKRGSLRSRPALHSNGACRDSASLLQDNFQAPMEDSADYVYDLYYCEKAPENWNVRDILYMRPYNDVELCKSPKQLNRAVHDEEKHQKKKVMPSRSSDSSDDEDDSISDDERRLIFDEEEDYYESDDCDVNARDDDPYDSFMAGGSAYDISGNLDDYDYDDTYCNDIIADQLADYGITPQEDYVGGNDDVFRL